MEPDHAHYDFRVVSGACFCQSAVFPCTLYFYWQLCSFQEVPMLQVTAPLPQREYASNHNAGSLKSVHFGTKFGFILRPLLGGSWVVISRHNPLGDL